MKFNIKYTTILALICLSNTAAYAIPVTVGDRIWRQVTQTANISYATVAEICSIDGMTQCKGSRGGVSFDGWI